MVITKTFYDWCVENDKEWILDLWDYNLNKVSPKDVGYKTDRKFYFNCDNPLHKPCLKALCTITKAKELDKSSICIGCRSFGEYIRVNYGIEFLKKIWSDKNEVDPFEILSASKTRIYINNFRPNRSRELYSSAGSIKNSIDQFMGKSKNVNSGKRMPKLSDEYNLAVIHPESIELWSDLNDKTPYDYKPGSNAVVYMKCADNKHEDYKRRICAHVQYGFRCPACVLENREYPNGSDSPYWNPNLSEDRRMRKSDVYSEWRKAVFERDGYLCQCCLDPKHNRLNAHHIKSFAQFPELRLDTNNGITLCTECHDGTVEGSLHNVYGTHNVTPNILIKYVNDKRAELGMDIPFELQGVS